MSSFDISTFQTHQNYVLDASAGTGKTYNIVNMLTHMISDPVSPVRLEKILVVTYTEKAAQELKDRIHKELPEADVTHASISTIHSFCQNAISEFCISSGLPSDMEVVDEIASTDFIRQYIRQEKILEKITLIQEMFRKEHTPTNDNVNDDIQFKGYEDTLIKKFRAVLSSYYLNADHQEDQTVAVLKTENLEDRIYYAHHDTLQEAPGEKLQSALETLKNSSNERLTDFYNSIIKDKNLNLPEGKKGPQAATLNTCTPEEQEAFYYIKGLKNDFHDSNKIVMYLIYEYSTELYQLWQQEKKKNCAQSYNDMLRNMREEVIREHSPLRDKLRQKYTCAIIDEFQDTNALQWDVLRSIFLCEGHNIIVVGDPKQSIYSFQGADITVYEKAKEEIISGGGIVASLDTNHRASQKIVESANAFFAYADGQPDDMQALPEAMNFRPSAFDTSKRHFLYNGKEEPAYWIESAPEENAEEAPDSSHKMAPEDQYAKLVCQTIIDCCTKDDAGHTRLMVTEEDGLRDVTFSDFAVLARTRAEMEPVLNALEKCGIPHMKYKDTSLFTGTECAHWTAVLEAVAVSDFSGKNRALFRRALFTSFFGYSLYELNSSQFDYDSSPEFLLIQHWHTLCRNGQWETLINEILVRSRLQHVLSSVNAMKKFGVFKQLADYCLEYLAKHQSIESLVNHLKEQQKNGGADAGEQQNLTAISTDFECVKVMTIHASKGLEFPVVISAAGFKKPKSSADIYSYHEKGQRVLSFEKNKNLCNKETREEWQRLFYVAYTRAKYVLILPCLGDKTGLPFIGNSIRRYIEGGNPWRQLENRHESEQEMSDAVKAILAGKEKTGTDGITEETQRERLKQMIADKQKHTTHKHAYSSLSHQHPKKETATEDGIRQDEAEDTPDNSLASFDRHCLSVCCSYTESEPMTLSPNFPAGASLGNAIHEVLELADYRKDPEEARDLIIKSFRKEGFKKIHDWDTDVVEMLRHVLEAALPVIHGAQATGETFTLQSVDMAHRKNEAEFNFNRENEFLRHYFNGFIDLLIERNGYYLVLDWKTDRLSDTFLSYHDKDEMKTHIDELYSIQRVLYSYCLIRWLQNFYPEMSLQEIFAQHFGGVYYVCVRGCKAGTGNGIYAQTWDSFETLEKAYLEIVKERIG